MRIDECTMCDMVVRVYIEVDYNAKHSRNITSLGALWDGHPISFTYIVKSEVECLGNIECPRCESFHSICLECAPAAITQGFECVAGHAHVNVRELRDLRWVLT
jgi:hypothetical protein